ncbi:ABC transporter substrate-binding protein [Rhizobium leguminosarum]|uniref:ABC transporter substrate-binding protein n=1 Tax=Rhizobium leguminosarum TaxID=384 RepID=UPI001C961489|nr:ABC transporter substrate-binding protein [Rhizobium leguminosarum]MBY5720920.1 ABC transporter substrate-binding protein [Rhizobium leguminosarum]
MDITRRSYLQAMSALSLIPLVSPKFAFAQSRSDIIVGVQANPPQLDPLRLGTNPAYRVTASIYDMLIRVDRNNGDTLVSGLAESWKKVNDTTWDITIREGVRFHDGSVMTTEDVAFTFGPERMLTEGLPSVSFSRQFFSGLEKVSAVDARTVRFVTKQPDPLFEFRLSSWASQIISKAAFKKVGDWDKWALAPIGTGPYKVAEVIAGDRIRLVAHNDYWGGKPPFTSVTFKIIPEAASRVNALAAGDVHLITEVTADQMPTIKGHNGLAVVGGAVNNIRTINYGTVNGPLKDARIRRAIDLAIDRQVIAEQLFAGLVGVPKGFQWENYGDMYIENFPKPGYEPEAAKKLLAEAGYKGEPIEYRTRESYYTAELDTAQALQQMWQDVGLNVQLKVVENDAQLYAQPNNAIFNGSVSSVYPDLMGSLWTTYGPNSFIRFLAKSWSNAEFDAIGVKLTTLTDRAERRKLHQRVLEIFAYVDPPSSILHETPMFYGMRADLGFVPHKTPMMDFGPFNVRT